MNAPVKASSTIPFDSARLDRLMDEAGMDVLIANSKHNVQYLLGGHRAFFFDYMDAMGLSRYLPVLVYAKGAPDKAACQSLQPRRSIAAISGRPITAWRRYQP